MRLMFKSPFNKYAGFDYGFISSSTDEVKGTYKYRDFTQSWERILPGVYHLVHEGKDRKAYERLIRMKRHAAPT